MARGWESKAVEAQQAERQRGDARGPVVTAAERERLQRRRGLELSRTRLEASLASASSDAHRRGLEAALADLDRQLAALTDPKAG